MLLERYQGASLLEGASTRIYEGITWTRVCSLLLAILLILSISIWTSSYLLPKKGRDTKILVTGWSLIRHPNLCLTYNSTGNHDFSLCRRGGQHVPSLFPVIHSDFYELSCVLIEYKRLKVFWIAFSYNCVQSGSLHLTSSYELLHVTMKFRLYLLAIHQLCTSTINRLWCTSFRNSRWGPFRPADCPISRSFQHFTEFQLTQVSFGASKSTL